MGDLRHLFRLDARAATTELKTKDIGLTAAEAADRLERYGRNELPAPEATPLWKLVLKQFEEKIVLILLGAAVVSFVLAFMEEGEDRLTAFFEPAVILFILVANATVGVVQETNAEKSIEALRKSEARECAVIRNGAVVGLPAAELVPGDVIHVDVGDKVPADCRLIKIETATLSVDESLLTGESAAVSKVTEAVEGRDPVPAEMVNCIFSGTLVVRGKAVAVVCSTGSGTEMGRIAKDLSESEESKTPLQEKLDEFGDQLSKIISIICVVVWLINFNHFTDPVHGSWLRGAVYYFKIAVALAVAAIPEGLPAVVTTCLALGTLRMAKKNAIVRSLPSVETLGCTTVICSDKTGTLTTNKMSVQSVITLNEAKRATCNVFSVSGDSFAPYGGVLADGRTLALPAVESAVLAEISKICSLCNESELNFTVDKGLAVWGKTGTPTEAALKVLSEKLGVPDEKLADSTFRSSKPADRVSATASYWRKLFKRQHLLEFDRVRKSASTVDLEVESGKRYLHVKGASEEVIERCSHVMDGKGQVHKMTKAVKEALLAENERAAEAGLRCLALAFKEDEEERNNEHWTNMDYYAEIESDLTFVGLACMLDPPRAGVDLALAKCRDAHIRVIVITGDNKATAESIGRRIGLFTADEDLEGKSFTGSEFFALPAADQDKHIRIASLFSRVEPSHKLRLVELLKGQGEITAMTGDGVNDAPALKAAHIGIAMGSGTDVAREASNMVLQDDNFGTIVMAVEEGRAIYSNTKQFIRYLISSNIGEVACIFMTAAIGMPEALIPVQLLWVNLVTDGLPATALGFNPADDDIMQKPPRNRSEGIINGWMFFRYMVIGVYVGVSTVMGFIHWFMWTPEGPRISYQQLTNFHHCHHNQAIYPAGFDCSMFADARPSTISLSILVTIEMFNALNALSENQSLVSVPPWRNKWVLLAIAMSFFLHFVIVYVPFFSKVFHVAALNVEEWSIVLLWSFPVIILDEILKFISRQLDARREADTGSKKDD